MKSQKIAYGNAGLCSRESKLQVVHIRSGFANTSSIMAIMSSHFKELTSSILCKNPMRVDCLNSVSSRRATATITISTTTRTSLTSLRKIDLVIQQMNIFIETEASVQSVCYKINRVKNWRKASSRAQQYDSS